MSSSRINENISEYIIRMYRSEDLVRAFEFDLEKIGTHVITHLPTSNIDKLSEVNFYESLISKMKSEGLETSGHLKELNTLVGDLTKLNDSLVKTNTKFQEIYKDAKPFIEQNLSTASGTITNEIQICLNGIYGFLLLKLNGKEVDGESKEMLEKFGALLAYLSTKYAELSQEN